MAMDATNGRLGVEGQQTTEPDNQQILIRHAVFVGLTRLIPIPVLDNVAKSCFRKHLVRKIAATEGRSLSDEDVDALVSERTNLKRLLLKVLVFPLKLISGTLFYIMKIKFAGDVVGRTYHFGYLLSYAMRNQAGEESLLDRYGAPEVSGAIQYVWYKGHFGPLESAVDGTFRKSMPALRAGAAMLAGRLHRLKGLPPVRIAEAVAQLTSDEEREIEPVVQCLQHSIASIPEEYFQALRTQLDHRLGGLPPDVAPSGTSPAKS